MNELIRRHTDDFVKLRKDKWRKLFDKLWEEASKQIVKSKTLNDSRSNFDQFKELLKEQYYLFKQESIDNHHVSYNKIHQRYIQPIISKQQEIHVL